MAELIARFLDFLDRIDGKGTFFVVGDVAREEPALIRRIAAAGHEIACHSDRHVPLDQQTPAAFREDLARNLEALEDAGERAVRGYRAPCFSLTHDTQWAYEILAELGLRYSSSVLPARSPLYGWPGFGAAPRLIGSVVELPITLLPFRLAPFPMGGVYFRALPRPLLRRAFQQRLTAGVVAGYLHPYDIDETPGSVTHPELPRFGPWDQLMRLNRGAVVSRLDMVVELGFSFVPYGEHADHERRRLQHAHVDRG